MDTPLVGSESQEVSDGNTSAARLLCISARIVEQFNKAVDCHDRQLRHRTRERLRNAVQAGRLRPSACVLGNIACLGLSLNQPIDHARRYRPRHPAQRSHRRTNHLRKAKQRHG